MQRDVPLEKGSLEISSLEKWDLYVTHPSFTDVFLGLLLFVDYYWCLSVRWSVTSECMPAMRAEASAFEQTPLGEGAAFLAREKPENIYLGSTFP